MRLVRFAIILVLSLITTGVFAAGISYAESGSSPALGVFLDNPSSLGNFETEIGRPVDSFHTFYAIGDNLDTGALGPVAAQGKTIMVSLEMWNPNSTDPINQPAYQLINITNGSFDSDIHRWASELRDFGYPVLLRPMPEMNGDWTPWGGTVNGNTPSDFIPAWRHIHDIFVQENAANVKFVWSPNADYDNASATSTFDAYYPGDAYVDYTGLDGYNWGTSASWGSQWQSFTDIFAPSYDVFTARTAKPVIICETASTEQGGNKAQWISDMFAQLPARFPRITQVTWFNVNKETDWRVESSTASLAAFRAALLPKGTPPVVNITSPAAGAIVSGQASVEVSASDNVGVTRVELYAGGLLVGSSNAAPHTFTLDTQALANGTATLTAKAYDGAGNSSAATLNVTVDNSTDRDCYFGWYDDASRGMQSWVVIGNPGTDPQQAQVYIAGRLMGSYDIGPGQRVTPTYPGTMDGPVKVVSTTGGELLASERTLYNGNFSEFTATAEQNLSQDAYLAWYDDRSMQTWVIVANQGNQPADVDISSGSSELGHYTVPAGGRITPQFANVMDGPLHVTSASGQPLIISGRSVYGTSFNETAAVPAASLASENFFTWYDNLSPGMQTWIVIDNPGSGEADADVYVAGELMGHYSVAAGQHVTPKYIGTMNGPVRVVTANGQPLIVSERSVYGGSFDENNGQIQANFSSQQWFAWYDSTTPNMNAWLLIGNQGSQPANVSVKIAGVDQGDYLIPPGGRVTPIYPGQMNGPVEVASADSDKLIVSQRVIYKGSFSEIHGMGL